MFVTARMPVKIGKLSSKQQQNASNGMKDDKRLEASNIRGEVGGQRKSRREGRFHFVVEKAQYVRFQ